MQAFVAAGFNMLNFSRFKNVWRLPDKFIASAQSGMVRSWVVVPRFEAIKSGKTNLDGRNLLIEGHKKRTHFESFLEDVCATGHRSMAACRHQQRALSGQAAQISI